jgi:hypothetical protein
MQNLPSIKDIKLNRIMDFIRLFGDIKFSLLPSIASLNGAEDSGTIFLNESDAEESFGNIRYAFREDHFTCHLRMEGEIVNVRMGGPEFKTPYHQKCSMYGELAYQLVDRAMRLNGFKRAEGSTGGAIICWERPHKSGHITVVSMKYGVSIFDPKNPDAVAHIGIKGMEGVPVSGFTRDSLGATINVYQDRAIRQAELSLTHSPCGGDEAQEESNAPS